MKFELELSKEELKEIVTNKIAEKIFEKYEEDSWFGIGHDSKDIFKKKAQEILTTDKAFEKRITKMVREALSDKKTLNIIAKELIKEKLEHSDY